MCVRVSRSVPKSGDEGRAWWGPFAFAKVYAGNYQPYGQNADIAMGTTGAHELVHVIAHIGDIKYDGFPNLMNVDAIKRKVGDPYSDEINPTVHGFAKLTPEQVNKLFKKCMKKHPSKIGRGKTGGAPQSAGGEWFLWTPIIYGAEGITTGPPTFIWIPYDRLAPRNIN